MSESYERSYYEIALTNNQVLSALAVLLLCLLASFVAGMWVARGATEPVQGSISQPATTVAEGEPEESGEAFRFFGRRSNNPENGAEVRPLSTGPADTVPSDPDRSVQTASPPERVARTVSPVEVGNQQRSEPTRSEPAPARPATDLGGRAPRDPPAAEPTAAAPAPIEPAADQDEERKLGEMLVIQVLSSSDQTQAGGVVAKLKESGYRAFLSPVVVEGRTMYRVRIGPYSDRAQAEQAEERIKRAFQLDTWITARN